MTATSAWRRLLAADQRLFEARQSGDVNVEMAALAESATAHEEFIAELDRIEHETAGYR